MQEAVPVGEGAMAAVLGMADADVEECCRLASDTGYVAPANYNCPGQLVIAGETAAVERACEICKEKGAKRIFVFATFGLFCNGLELFDKAYADGTITKIFTTNLIYRTPELLTREWYGEVNMCKYVSYIIDTLNHDYTISKLLDPVSRIHNLLDKHKAELAAKQE